MIVVGSLNPGKITPVQDVMERHWPELQVRGATVPSGVPPQPIGFDETMDGARRRAHAALNEPGATWGVGLEGGVSFDSRDTAWLFGVVVVVHAGRESVSRSGSLQLPPFVGRRVWQGEEVGPIIDELSGLIGSKQKLGAVGYLTGGLIERADVWRQTLALALTPFLRPELY